MKGVRYLPLALAVGCATPRQAQPVAASAPPPPARQAPSHCPEARTLEASARADLAGGKLLHALATLERAVDLCPGLHSGRSLLASTRAELGAGQHLDGHKLLAQALALPPRAAGGRRAFERALYALEQSSGKRAGVEGPVPADDRVEISDDGAHAVDIDSTKVRVYDAAGGRQLLALPASDAVFVERGTAIAVELTGGPVQIRSLATGAVERTLAPPDTGGLKLMADRQGDILVTRGPVHVDAWDVASGRHMLDVPAPQAPGPQAALSGDGRLLAVDATLYEPRTGKKLFQLPLELSAHLHVTQLRFDSAGATLSLAVEAWRGASKEERRKARTWIFDLASRREVRRRPGAAGASKCACAGEKVGSWRGQPVCSASGHARLCDAGGHIRDLGLETVEWNIEASLARRAPRLAVLRNDRLHVLDFQTGRVVVDRKLPDALAIALSPDGALLAVGTDSGLEVMDTQTGRVRFRLPSPAGDDRSVAFSPDGRFVVMSDPGRYVVTKTTGADVVFRGEGTATAFSHQSQLLASGTDAGAIEVRRLDTGKVVLKRSGLESFPINLLAFSPDDRQLFVSGHVLRSFDMSGRRAPTLLAGRQEMLGGPLDDAMGELPDGSLLLVQEATLRRLLPADDHMGPALPLFAEPPLDTNQAGDFVVGSRGGLRLGRSNKPASTLELGFAGARGDLYLVARDGRYEILDPGARAALACRVGPVFYPLALCAGEYETRGLMAGLLR